ncbi:MAG TPA: ABC transporter substrate-binding protein, partial [Paenirhodobacter sp.]
SYRWVDDVTLEFKLRKGIKFHNGDAFSADDVVYTLNHFSDPATGVAMPNTVGWIKSAEKTGDYTVIVHLKDPFPTALDYLESSMPIYPAAYYQKVGSAGFAQKPVGTGPYMINSIDPGRGYTLKANADYQPNGSRGKAAIGTVVVRSIPDVNTQIAELFSGSVDFIWQVPEDQTQKIMAKGGYTVTSAPTVRFGYISMDAVGRSGFEAFKDKRVREAVYHAIDRKAIRDAFFTPEAGLTNAICSPLQFGCDQDVTIYGFDPEKSKALLKEAGYEKGLEVSFYAYRDRQAAEAMVQMLSDVGITANMNYIKYATLAEKVLKNEIPMSFMTWGSGSILDVSASTSKFFDGSSIDDVKNPELTALLKQGDTTTDPEKRKVFYSKALKQVADEAYWVPLWAYTTNYVMAPALDFTPTPDEYVRFYDMKWK